MLEQSIRSRQVQKMMPQTVYSLQLLSMPLFSLKTYLDHIALGNPYLEPCYGNMEIPISSLSVQEDTGYDAPIEDSGAAYPRPEADFAFLEFQDHLFGRQEYSLYEHLRFQAELCSFSPGEAGVAGYLIAHIGSTGYLEESLEEIQAAAGCSNAVAENILRVIQTFSPRGVGARNLSECLCLQVDAAVEDYSILMEVLREDLAALAQRKFAYLGRKYKVSRPRLQKMLDYVQTLDPRPGSCFAGERYTPYILPDVSVRFWGQQVQVQVKGDAGSLLTFDPDYMKEAASADAVEFLAQKKREAADLIRSIDMRHRALQLLTAYLVDQQWEFFVEGPQALRPMTQKKAAEAIGMHPSTVCRCIRDKYISTPWGTFPLQHFFSGGIGPGEYPAKLAQSAVGALIAKENKSAPLSDLEIAKALSDEGIQLSRRTVAKYRAQLGLGGQAMRIRYE